MFKRSVSASVAAIARVLGRVSADAVMSSSALSRPAPHFPAVNRGSKSSGGYGGSSVTVAPNSGIKKRMRGARRGDRGTGLALMDPKDCVTRHEWMERKGAARW